MSLKRYISSRWPALWATLSLALFPPSTAFADGQATLLGSSSNTYDHGHHDDRNRAVQHGFDAFADLAALNIGGAIDNGITAYTAYQNSRSLTSLGNNSAA